MTESVSENSAWTMSALQFRLLWADAAGTQFPAELCAFGDEKYDTADDQIATEKSELTRLRAATTSAKSEAITALTRPRYTIGMLGLDARKPLSDTSSHLRVVSAWGGSGEHVIVVRQKPGPSPSHGGEVSVTRSRLDTWTDDLVRLLPTSSGPGRLPADADVPFYDLPIDVEVLRQVSADAPKTTAAGAFVHEKPTTCGSIRVQVGSEVDGRRPERLTLQYRDIDKDGRYLLVIDSPGTAVGVDDARMASSMRRAVNAVKKRYDSRASAEWG
ncbi:hypothetical protein [Williamsia sp. M5A3_1d]